MVGGKGQKRKRSKKEAVKAPRKKKKGTPWQQTNNGRVKSDNLRFGVFLDFCAIKNQRSECLHTTRPTTEL